MSVWRFVSFSDSRYLTVGPSARRLCAAMLTGMGSMMGFARRQPGVSDYSFHGVARLNPDTMNLAVLAAMSCGPGEGLNAELMEDGRIVKRLDWLDEVVQIDVQAVRNLSRGALEMFALLSTWTATQLHSNANRVVMITRSYIDFKIFGEARSYPGCLCLGDKNANLGRLSNMDICPTTDSVAA